MRTLGPIEQLLQPLVLLANVVVGRHVAQKNRRLGCQKLQRVNVGNVGSGPLSVAHILAGLDPLLQLDGHVEIALLGLVNLAHHFFQTSHLILDQLQILATKLMADNLQVANRVNVAFHVRHVGIIKHAHNLQKSINRANVTQKVVSKTLSRMSTLYQAETKRKMSKMQT